MTEAQEILLQEAEKKTFLVERGYTKDDDWGTYYKEFWVEEKHLMFLKRKKFVNFVGVKFYRDGMTVKSLGENNVENAGFKVQYEQDGWWSHEEFKGIVTKLEAFSE
jgi:hypothetical protein